MAANSVLRANLRSSGKRLWRRGSRDHRIGGVLIVTGMMLVASLSQSVTDEAEQQVAGRTWNIIAHDGAADPAGRRRGRGW